jgi:hypothetical protein
MEIFREEVSMRPFLMAAIGTVSISAMAAHERASLDIRLTCPAQHYFLDRTLVQGMAHEQIMLKAKPFDVGKDAKTGKPQVGWMTEAKITSNKRTFEASLLANGAEYAVIAYADLQRSGISGSVQTVIYQIDLATLQLKRTITFFPTGRDVVAEGMCKKL